MCQIFHNSALLTLLCFTLTSASLPASVVPVQHIPGDHISSHSIPLLDGTTLNPSNTESLPLLIFNLDSTDPFTTFLGSSPSSIDAFLHMGSHSINRTRFLFTAWQNFKDVLTLHTLFTQRLQLLPTALANKWKQKLHFTNGTSSETLGLELVTTLQQWSSPRNIISPLNITRLDCKYTFCPWPEQDATFTLVASQQQQQQQQQEQQEQHAPAVNACADHGNMSHSNSYMFLQLPAAASTPSCTPTMAAAAAIKSGAKGVILAVDAADDGIIPPVGNDGGSAGSQGLNVPIALVSSTSGDQLAHELQVMGTSALSLSFATHAGVGQFLAIDHQGKLAEVGWEKYSTMQMLGWQAQALEFQMARTSRTNEPAFVVPVFNAALTGSTASVTLPPKSLLSQFGAVELDFSLNCPIGNRDEECSVWDRIVSVTAACTMEEMEVTKVKEKEDAPTLSSAVASFEVGRWINAFQRQGHWLTRTVTLPRSLGGRTCNFTFNVGLNNPWRATLNIRYTDYRSLYMDSSAVRTTNSVATTNALPFLLLPIQYVNPSESFTSSSYNMNKSFSFQIPPSTTRVEIASLITGHAGCEFIATSHHFIVNHNKIKEYNTTSNPTYYQRFMEAGTDFGCANKIGNGATPNEHGTWYFGRNGWCNGQDVKPLQWDITDSIDLNERNQTIDYFALAYPLGPTSNGTESGCNGNIRQSSFVVLYSK